MNFRKITRLVKARVEASGLRDDCAYARVPASLMEAYGTLLVGFAGDATGNIVEIGTNVGYGAIAMAYGARLRYPDPPQPVFSFDISPPKLNFSRLLALDCGMDNLHVVQGRAVDVHQYVLKGDLGLGFIDGDHSYDGCTEDLERLAELLCPYGRLLVHDFMVNQDSPVNDACFDFLKRHPDFDMVYLGHAMVVLGRYARNAQHPKATNADDGLPRTLGDR